MNTHLGQRQVLVVLRIARQRDARLLGLRQAAPRRLALRLPDFAEAEPLLVHVLLLDEATSALDGITEEKVMSSIQKLSGEKTILLIAHRLTTLQECDTIFLLNEGKLIDQGNFQYLMESNLTFRQMARKESEKNILESQKIS